MSNEGFKFQASVKDTDGDMVNVRADSAEEFAHYLENFPVGEYAQFKANVRGGSALGQMAAPQPTAAPQQQAQPTWSQPAPQAAPAVPQVRLHPEGEACTCGRVLEFKRVERKSDNKVFEFWTCPAQQKRDDGHTSKFAS